MNLGNNVSYIRVFEKMDHLRVVRTGKRNYANLAIGVIRLINKLKILILYFANLNWLVTVTVQLYTIIF